jgi:hypothetical protein
MWFLNGFGKIIISISDSCQNEFGYINYCNINRKEYDEGGIDLA